MSAQRFSSHWASEVRCSDSEIIVWQILRYFGQFPSGFALKISTLGVALLTNVLGDGIGVLQVSTENLKQF